jgi:hypothetical protein
MDKNLTIAAYVETFIKQRAGSPEPRFFAENVRRFVMDSSGSFPAPGSTDRIMRKLRKEGKVNYQLLNRAKSYYLALPISITSVDPTDWQNDEL